MSNNNSNILVCGLGSIGSRHLHNIRNVWPDAVISVLRRDANTPYDAKVEEKIDRIVETVTDALNPRPLAAIIANPAPLHVELGVKLAEAGIHLLVEKPLSHETKSAETLVVACEKQQVKLLVGYNLRFNRLLQQLKTIVEGGSLGRIMSVRSEVGQYLPDWRPGKPYQTTVSARPELGGGVLLELSHELDYLSWMFGKPDSVYAKIGKYSDLELDVEDTAELLLEFRDAGKSSTILANVHLDMTQRSPTRTCKVVGTDGTAVWDGIENNLKFYDASKAQWIEVTHVDASADLADRNDMYLQELQHFRNCIENDEQPVISGIDGVQVLKVIEAARQSSIQDAAIRFPD